MKMSFLENMMGGNSGKRSNGWPGLNDSWYGQTGGGGLFISYLLDELGKIGFKPSIINGQFSMTDPNLVLDDLPITLEGHFAVYTNDRGDQIKLQHAVGSQHDKKQPVSYSIILEATKAGVPGHKKAGYIATPAAVQSWYDQYNTGVFSAMVPVSVDEVMKTLGLAPQLPMGKN